MAYLDQIFQEEVPQDRVRAILKKIAFNAERGDLRAAAFLFDRMYGKAAASSLAVRVRADASDEVPPDLSYLTDDEVDTIASLLKKARELAESSPAGHGDEAEFPDTLPF